MIDDAAPSPLTPQRAEAAAIPGDPRYHPVENQASHARREAPSAATVSRTARAHRARTPGLDLLRGQRYWRHFLREDGKQTAIVMVVMSAAAIATSANDFLLLRGSSLLGVSLASRVVLLVATAVVLVLLRRASWPRQQHRAFNLALIGTVSMVLGTHLTRIPSGNIQGIPISIGALLCILYFAQRGPIRPRAVVGGVMVVTAITVVCTPHAAMTLTTRVMSVVAVIGLNIIGVLTARAFEEQRRKRFDAERRERHARQELAVKLLQLAVEKERAEAMSRARAAFLAAMSHEFRTPMNAVIGLSDLLLDAPLALQHREYARTISDSARALLAQLNDILDFAKIDAQKVFLSPVPFDLRKLAASVVDMMRPQAMARSLDLILELSPDVPQHLVSDDARLRQVLVNLVSNAIKFTERGAVRLRITARALEGSDHEITCRVEDTGIGMAPDVIARLFRPFEQADEGIARRHGGTGLGLAISKQIVLAMGGDIRVESESGRGSVFSFALRLAAVATPMEVTALALSDDLPPLAILVVDDNAINRDVARAGIGRIGYRVDLANGGQEAIKAVENKDYDVVFMDLRMPEMSGIEATARIGERLAGKRAPHIIAMTASVFEEDREACRTAGMCDFVGKPIDLAQIDAVLRRVAAERGASTARGVKDATLAAGPIAKLLELDGLSEPGFFVSLCQLFLVETEKRLPRMRDALGRGDVQAIEDEAHLLKSASATLGATAMSDLCGRVEGAARTGHLDEIQAILDALSVEHLEVHRALTQEMQSRPLPGLREAL